VSKNKKIRQLHSQQKGKCIWCGCKTYLIGTPLNEIKAETGAITKREAQAYYATVEHIMPVSLGGHKTAKINRLMACKRCNSKRGQSFLFKPLSSVVRYLRGAKKKHVVGIFQVGA
jgi:5-methylcytosine-specific restriction endonuclease McrA